MGCTPVHRVVPSAPAKNRQPVKATRKNDRFAVAFAQLVMAGLVPATYGGTNPRFFPAVIGPRDKLGNDEKRDRSNDLMLNVA